MTIEATYEEAVKAKSILIEYLKNEMGDYISIEEFYKGNYDDKKSLLLIALIMADFLE